MVWPLTVTHDGNVIALADVHAELTVRHGRDGAYGAPSPSTATLILEPVTHAQAAAFHVGRELVVTATDAGGSFPLFKGDVSDAELVEDRVRLTAAGPLAGALRASFNPAGWPAESWSARAARVFTAVGLTATVQADPAFDPILEPPTADPDGKVMFSRYVLVLAAAVECAICDGPDGVVVCQALGARASSATKTLDPASVLYAPAWSMSLDVVNTVTVQYGPDSAPLVTSSSDSASIATYGPRALPISGTNIRTLADAGTRATVRLARGSQPHWSMRTLTLLDRIRLAIGDRLVVDELPPSSPYLKWFPVLEGWVDHIRGDAWTSELAVSDPIASGLALTWAAAPADRHWNDLPASLDWFEALTTADLYP